MRGGVFAALLALARVLAVPAARARSTGSPGPPGAAASVSRVATVTRPPFSLVENGADSGFSMDLWRARMDDMGTKTGIVRPGTFGEMLDMVRRGEVDAAVANISVTAEREAVMDFSQPIFESGLQVMVPSSGRSGNALGRVLWSGQLFLAIAAAFGLLTLAGMLMWFFERRHQPYFNHPPGRAVFPAFWWALNLVVNGGFEERQPQTVPGRLLGVALVVSSLFLVSVFVANIRRR